MNDVTKNDSLKTSFAGLYTRSFPAGRQVRKIEIPLLQRDYAQGRPDPQATRIRGRFLDSLIAAATGGGDLSLDFVYGELKGGALLPLDGQQRLTTLFLLHWYLAARCGRLSDDQPWKSFTYSTRASARLFCEHLVACNPDFSGTTPSGWLTDQPWFMQTWDQDPTVQSMLVVLDDIDHRMSGQDCSAAWLRLVDAEAPAITFHVLPLEDMGLSDDVYIKMNSRGKPLTAFEMFKARFEKLLESRSPEHARSFALNIDTVWADIFWTCSDQNGIVDDAMLRYMRFATDMCGWLHSRVAIAGIDEEALAVSVYGPNNPAGEGSIRLLFGLLEVWEKTDVNAWFDSLFVPSKGMASHPWQQNDPVRLFRPADRSNCSLFEACCRSYDSGGRNRDFGWPEALLFYATIVHKQNQTPEPHRRLRIIRNLIEGSPNELRSDRMPALVADVFSVMNGGALSQIAGFNKKIHAADEEAKAAFVLQHPAIEPALRELEDHPLLRGCLVAFELDEKRFEQRARAFAELFADDANLVLVTGALLAAGNYSVCIRDRVFLFGSSRNALPWRELLTSSTRSGMAQTRDTMAVLLDHVSARGQVTVAEALTDFTSAWLARREKAEHYDWRYYFVRYDVMRSGASGRYVGEDGRLGYSVCMLNKIQMNSYYRDPYLQAIRQAVNQPDAIEDCYFTGYETDPRWMPVREGGIAMRVTSGGFIIVADKGGDDSAYRKLLEAHGCTVDNDSAVFSVPQKPVGDTYIDTSDRIQLGAALLKGLIESVRATRAAPGAHGSPPGATTQCHAVPV